MKKYILIALAMVASFTVNAQEQQEQVQQPAEETSSNSVDVKAEEGSFSMEIGFVPFDASPVELAGGQLRGIYALTDNWSLRLGLGFGVHSYEVDDVTTTTRHFTITPGVSYFFDGTDRLAPYIGGELLASFAKNRDDIEGENPDPSSTSFGATAFTGFNYYFAEYLYIGAEIGIGFKSTSYDDDETESGTDESNVSFETLAYPSLRLGWTF